MREVFDDESVDHSNERFEIECAVRSGHMTPDEAETWAREHQRLPFYLAGLMGTQVMLEQIWRLPYAALWIATRQSDLFEKEVASHIYWKEHIWRNRIREGQRTSTLQAETMLKAALLSGDIKASGNVAWERDYISRGPIRSISREEWTQLVWTRQADGVLTEPVDGEPRYLDAFVLRDEILARWPAAESADKLDRAVQPALLPTNPVERRSGPKADKAERIKSQMRALPRERLRAMKNAEMASLFQASASYCGQLRSAIEAEGKSVR